MACFKLFSQGTFTSNISGGSGNRNRSASWTYTGTDAYLLPGRSYYRLKQTDFNGDFEYSEIISMLYEHESQNLHWVKNPIHEVGSLKFRPGYDGQNYPMNISIKKPNGQFVHSWSLDISGPQPIGPALPFRISSGFYLIFFGYREQTVT